MKHLAVTAGLLLLVQAFHLATLQYSTDSPRRTIDKSWLRELAKNTVESGNTAFTGEETENDQITNILNNDDSNSGIASGFLAGQTDEEESLTRQYDSENTTYDGQNDGSTTMATPFDNGTLNSQLELTDSPGSTSPTQTNVTEGEEDFKSPTADSTTSFQNSSNYSESEPTTVASGTNTTGNFTAPADTDNGSNNSTGSTNPSNSTGSTNTTNPMGSTSTANPMGSTNTANPMGSTNTANPMGSTKTTIPGPSDTTSITEIPTIGSTTPFERSETIAMTPALPERANKTGKGVSNLDTGEDVEPDTYRNKRSVAWVVVLGMSAAVACVGLVVYIVKKKRSGFSHRKLVEEYPSDPVLRLDNSEPLDLNFAGSGGYYNPGLQGDNIQMTSFPGHR